MLRQLGGYARLPLSRSRIQPEGNTGMNFKSIGRCSLILAVLLFGEVPANAETGNLPARSTPIPSTTNGVPHVQIGVEAIPEISAELLRRVSNIRGVEIRDTVISLPGAKGFWINETITLSRPDAIVGGREFAHIHPDGSPHASLPLVLAKEAVKSGWAAHHPWADQRPGWEGFVMLYTPGTMDEMEVVYRLVVASYNFVTK